MYKGGSQLTVMSGVANDVDVIFGKCKLINEEYLIVELPGYEFFTINVQRRIHKKHSKFACANDNGNIAGTCTVKAGDLSLKGVSNSYADDLNLQSAKCDIFSISAEKLQTTGDIHYETNKNHIDNSTPVDHSLSLITGTDEVSEDMTPANRTAAVAEPVSSNDLIGATSCFNNVGTMHGSSGETCQPQKGPIKRGRFDHSGGSSELFATRAKKHAGEMRDEVGTKPCNIETSSTFISNTYPCKVDTEASSRSHAESLTEVEMDVNSDQNRFTCSTCPNGDFQKSEGGSTIDRAEIYKCGFCMFFSECYKHYQLHIKGHSGNSDLYMCPRCDFSTPDYGKLIEHEKGVHLMNVKECSDCDYCCNDEINLKKLRECSEKRQAASRDTNIDDAPYQCIECNFSDESLSVFQLHMKNSHQQHEIKPKTVEPVKSKCKTTELKQSVAKVAAVKSLLCVHCGILCMSKGKLRSHMVVHRPEKPYICTQCPYRSKHAGHLKQHLKSKHAHKKIHQCPKCSFVGKWSNSLKSHIKRFHSDADPYVCDLCGYKNPVLSSFKNHMKSHENARPHRCNLCSYASTSKRCLVDHMNKHSGEMPYACTQCDYRASCGDTLKFHMQKHDGMTYKCDQCDYSSLQKQLLRVHKKVHSDEKPYKCTECDYRSKQAGTLRHHMIIHTGIKPFKCDHCNFACTHKAYLKEHMNKNTSATQEFCDRCGFGTVYLCALTNHITSKLCPL